MKNSIFKRNIRGGANVAKPPVAPKPPSAPKPPVPPKPPAAPKPTGTNTKPASNATKPPTTNTKNVGNAPKSNNVLPNSSSIKEAKDKLFDRMNDAVNNLKSKSSSLMDKGKNMVSTDTSSDNNSNFNKWGFILMVGVSIIIVLQLGRYLISSYYTKETENPYLVSGIKNASDSLVISQDKEHKSYIPIARSDDKGGIEFTYSFWMLITDLKNVNDGKWKHVFHKGSENFYPNRAPGVWIHPNTNSLRVYMNTFNNILENVDIELIPVKKWFCVHIVLSNTRTRNLDLDINVDDEIRYTLDIYINNEIKQSRRLKSIPRQNDGDLWVNLNGGYNGSLAKLRYYSKAVDSGEIAETVAEGPGDMVVTEAGINPPYLDGSYWTDTTIMTETGPRLLR